MRYQRWRLAAGGVAALAALGTLIAVPAAQAGTAQAGTAQATGSACPWVTSKAPVGQRVSDLMSQMTPADKISMVEGHGSSNPYVFYTPA
ncbi:MAG: hypothetical protein ACRDN0_24530, partial [Trebonia sp.]